MKKTLILLLLFLVCKQIVVFGYENPSAGVNMTLSPAMQKLIEKANDLRLKDINQALATLEEGRALAKKQNDIFALFKIEKSAGVIYEDNNRLENAQNQYNLALSYATQLNNQSLTANIYNDLAIVNKRMGKYKVAKDYYEQSLKIANQINDLKAAEFSSHGLGTLYETLGDYEKAIENYWNSIHLAEKRGSQSGVVNTLQNVAITYTKLKNHNTALETIEKAYHLARAEKDTMLIGSVIFDYGKVLNACNKPDEALNKFNESLQLFQALNYKPLIARCYFYIADTYTSKGNYELAQKNFLQCADYKDYISIKSYTELNNKLGALYLKLNQWSAAKESYLESYSDATRYELKDLKKDNALALADIYAHFGEFQKAFQFQNIASALRDTLYNDAQTKGITELQFKYDSEKSEKEIQTLKLRQTEYLMWFGLFLIISISAVSIYVIRLRGKNNNELSIKNRQIEEQNLLLKEKNAALEQFAYAAAHDLKEPLRNIGSFANLLQRRYAAQFDESAQEYMSFIVSGAKRMNDLLVGLLNFTALTNQKADNEEVQLTEIVEIVKANLKTAIEDKSANIIIANTLPSIPMHHLHLVQLFQNLISNALKFTERTPVIEIAAETTEKQITISIKDNGIGMDEAYESKVFRLFHRLNKNKNYEGSGVGLSICKNIVEKYGGKIWYESEVGNGTKFFIAIPKQQVALAA